MPETIESSPEWTADAVVKRLQEKTASGQPTSVQVFMKDNVSGETLPAKAQEIVEHASASLGLEPGAVRLGKVHRLAKSFSVISDRPQVFEAIARRTEVKSILESQQADILPKPVKSPP